MLDKQPLAQIDLPSIESWAARSATDPVVVVSPSGVILFATDGPHPWITARSRNLLDTLRESDRPIFRGWLQGIQLQTPIARGEFEFVAADNVIHPYEFTALRCKDDSQLALILLVGRDRIVRSSPRIAQLSAPGETSRLVHNLKANVIGNISHELRTPLNGIMGASDVLAQTKMSPSQIELVSCIRESSSHLADTLTDIADYEAITNGYWNFNNVQFDLGALLESIESEYSPAAESKNLLFRIVRDDGIPDQLYGDCENLARMIHLLLSNAVKFTHQGLISLQLHKKGIDDTTVAIVVEVLDTGVGIAENALKWICDPFRQADSSFAKKTDGLGLGLAICQLLAVRQRTRLHYESSLGEGSRFWIPLHFRRPESRSNDLAGN